MMWFKKAEDMDWVAAMCKAQYQIHGGSQFCPPEMYTTHLKKQKIKLLEYIEEILEQVSQKQTGKQ